MEEIKAIPTRYLGYHYRSRLEARWAVFFDAVELEYEYEREGYKLGNGRCYLPDFWFPQLQIHCEIKPHGTTIERTLYEHFREEISPILLLEGPPWEYTATWFGFDISSSSGGPSDFNAAIGCPGGSFGHIILEDKHDREFLLTDWSIAPYTINHIRGIVANIERNKYSGSHDAMTKARSARFEHGESGST